MEDWKWSRDEDLVDESRGSVLFLKDAIREHVRETVERYESRGVRDARNISQGRTVTASDERSLPGGGTVSYHVEHPETVFVTLKVSFQPALWDQRRADPLERPLTEQDVRGALHLSDFKESSIAPRILEALEDHLYKVQATDYQYDDDDDDPVPPREAHPNYQITSSREAFFDGGALKVRWTIRAKAQIAFAGERGYPF